MKIIKPNKKNIPIIVEILEKGGVVVCLTDTVYGFLCLAENKKAVEKIFKIKKRPKNKTLPMFVKDIKMAREIAEILPEQEKIIKKYWPGKFTFILKLKDKKYRQEQFHRIVPMVILNNTVALRMPKYKFLNDLLKKIDRPLAQTSVNISNAPAIYKSREIMRKFGKSNYIDLIIDAGDLKNSKPSKIIDLTNNEINILRK